MEYFLASVARDGRVYKERFADLGAAAARAVELCEIAQAQDGPRPAAITDTGERLLLGQEEIARLAAVAGKAAPAGDQLARRVFGGLDAVALDELCRWFNFRLRTAGVGAQQRLHVLTAILDAASPDE